MKLNNDYSAYQRKMADHDVSNVKLADFYDDDGNLGVNPESLSPSLRAKFNELVAAAKPKQEPVETEQPRLEPAVDLFA